MKKKRTNLVRAALTLLLAALCSVGARAESGKIIVWLNGGNTVPVLFSDLPEFTYSDGQVILKGQTTDLSWPIENVKKFTFEGINTGVKNVESLDIHSDNLSVYDLDGRLLRQHVKSLSELPKGTYIVKNGSVTIKVVRK